MLNSCDAYYGDTSSIVQDYRNAGKPVMIMDYDIYELEKPDEWENIIHNTSVVENRSTNSASGYDKIM